MIDIELNRKQQQSPVHKAISYILRLFFWGLGLINISLCDDSAFDLVFILM